MWEKNKNNTGHYLLFSQWFYDDEQARWIAFILINSLFFWEHNLFLKKTKKNPKNPITSHHLVVNRHKANEHYNSLEICKECNKYRKNIHTCPEKWDKIIFKQPQLFIWEWIHEYKNTAFDRQCWTTGSIYKCVIYKRKKGRKKEKEIWHRLF